MQKNNMNYIKVGDVVNTHGIIGELKIIRTGAEEFNRDINYFIEKTKVIIEKSRFHKNSFIVKLKNYDNINDVIKFKGKSIYISDEDLIDLEDEYYYIDLIGMDVFENDKLIGKLINIDSYKANDVYTVRAEDRDILIPAVDEFILNIDVENNKIDVKLIEGM